MLTKKSSIIYAALGTILCFLSVTYFSCTKVGKEPSCNGVHCLNGGICNKQGFCDCPNGYEGPSCATASVDKYIATWDVRQTTISSTITSAIGTVTNYQMSLQHSATTTAFLIYGFLGNPNYNQIACHLDTASSSMFHLDTLRPYNMIYDNYVIKPYGYGSFDAGSNTITCHFYTKHLNSTFNWQEDTYELVMTPHHL